MGLFDFLVPPDKLQSETLEYARKIAKGPSRAIGFTKIALTEGVGMPLWSAFAWERELQNQLFDSPIARKACAPSSRSARRSSAVARPPAPAPCPFCTSPDTSTIGAWATSMLTRQQRCRVCSGSYFENLRASHEP